MNLMPVLIMNLILIVIALLLIIADKFLGDHSERNIIINKDKEIPVHGDGTLLDFLSENRIYIPSACGGKGTCGFCKVQVTSGCGEILPTEVPFLSAEERGNGTRLACQIKIRNNMDIIIPEHMLDIKEYLGKVTEISDLTYDVKLIKIDLLNSDKLDFKAGQYVQIKVPGYEVFRAYSIASPPSDSEKLELIIRFVPGGIYTNFVHNALEVDDIIDFTGPYGDFFLQEDTEREIFCIARSTGLAPMMSILKHLEEFDMPRKLTCFYGASYIEDFFMLKELEAMEKKYTNFKLITALSRPKPEDNWTQDVGRITAIFEKYIESAVNCEAYLCGPAIMLEEGTRVLKRKGINIKDIYYDEF